MSTPLKPLSELEAQIYSTGGPGITRNGQPVPERQGMGLMFDCPCGCGNWNAIPFSNPIDGGPPEAGEHPTWKRTGDTIENLTLSPSILRRKDWGGCGWHGFVENGKVRTV